MGLSPDHARTQDGSALSLLKVSLGLPKMAGRPLEKKRVLKGCCLATWCASAGCLSGRNTDRRLEAECSTEALASFTH